MKKAIIALLTVGAVSSAQAALTIYVYESGSDVVVVANGSMDLTGLSNSSGGTLVNSNVNPGNGVVTIGTAGNFSVYTGLTSAPSNFGIFAVGWSASSGSGNIVGLKPGSVSVPVGYASLAPLSSTATFAGHTLADMGFSLGTYTWSWGSGGNADSATMNVGAVPEPSSVALLGLAGGFYFLRRRRY